MRKLAAMTVQLRRELFRKGPEELYQSGQRWLLYRKVIAVVSGKGGVGKSLVTSLLASEMQRRGHSAAILDADVTGPSIPQMFGVHEKARGGEDFILPAVSESGVKLMSMNILLQSETDPVVWRGPIIANAVEQFWTEVVWGDVRLYVRGYAPGTGDVPLTVFQSLRWTAW
jgi:Mrp family chromosome partitioning ATPase